MAPVRGVTDPLFHRSAQKSTFRGFRQKIVVSTVFRVQRGFDDFCEEGDDGSQAAE
jgi:hypothetical protein